MVVFQEVETELQIEKVAQLGEEIWNECYSKTLEQKQIDYMLEKFQSIKAIQHQLTEQGYRYFLVCDEEVEVGYIAVQKSEKGLFLSKLYLLAANRGGGITQQMFLFVKKQALKTACENIWLTVNRHNQRAIAAYKKRGFMIEQEQVVDIGGGFIMDDYVMELRLS